MDIKRVPVGNMGKVIRRLLLRGVITLGVFQGTAATGSALEKQVEEWIHRLKTDPIEARQKLIGEIRREAAPGSGHPPKVSSNRTDLFPVLEAALGNDDRHVRTEAICALSYMKCPAAFPILEQALQSDYWEVRYYACMGIGWLADEGPRGRGVQYSAPRHVGLVKAWIEAGAGDFCRSPPQPAGQRLTRCDPARSPGAQGHHRTDDRAPENGCALERPLAGRGLEGAHGRVARQGRQSLAAMARRPSGGVPTATQVRRGKRLPKSDATRRPYRSESDGDPAAKATRTG